MLSLLHRPSILILPILACLELTVSGQSLSIIKGSQNRLSLVASTPADARYTLEASKDLNLWLDINDAVSGTISNQVTSAGVAQRYFRLVPWTEPPSIIIVLVGDSTAADLASNLNYFNGWGQGMYDYLKPAAQFVNLAFPGYGTKKFLGSEQEARMLAIKPNYVLVELALVDAFNGPPEVQTTLPEYEANLRKIVQEIFDFGGTPILLTPQAVRLFDVNDKVIPVYQDRNDVIKKVAADMHVYVIDLNRLSIDFLNTLGDKGSSYLWGDWLHFTTQGAEDIAGLVVGALPPSLGPYIVPDRVLPSLLVSP